MSLATSLSVQSADPRTGDDLLAQTNPDVLNALAPFEPHYPGLTDKVRRDISHVYLQVEQAMFE